MNLFKWLAGLLGGGGASPGNRQFSVYLLSRRCNEPVAGQVDLLNELSATDEEKAGYYVRKVFRTSGRNRCFDQIEVELWFDQNKKLTEHQVQGGQWLELAEYEHALARWNTPPEEKNE
jgi:hypothetical protein